MKIKGKKITVMGIGQHGGAVQVIKWLLAQKAKVTATDLDSKQNLAKSLESLKDLKNLKIVTGQHRSEDFTLADMLIINPAISWKNKYVQMALKNNVQVEMDASLFFKMLPEKSRVVGVTGTKGKTTTALLIYEILKKADKKAVKVGIGQEPELNKLKFISKDSIAVFELSSWRLSALGRMEKSPQIAVITNIFPDHLNYYSSMESYVRDKKNIFLYQKPNDKLFLNWDNKPTREFQEEAKSEIGFFSAQNVLANGNAVYIRKGKIIWEREGEEQEICDLNEIKLKGAHNISNVLAAISAVLPLGIKTQVIKETLREFRKISHRIEFVRDVDGVKFYNDTTATIPQSAIVAINRFLKPIRLICGGSSKKIDMAPLARKICKEDNIKGIYLLEGTATDSLKKNIREEGGEGKIKGVFDNLEAAVNQVKSHAREGEIVLFSPGCASFGMFKNEFDRGEKFIKYVSEL